MAWRRCARPSRHQWQAHQVHLPGPLIDDADHSNIPDYITSLEALRALPVEVVHGGHFPRFRAVRFLQLINEYLAGKHAAGCHINSA